MDQRYLNAKKYFEAFGIDTEKVLEKLKTVPVSLHCWQLNDVEGFSTDGPLTGGIQTTGNYPGKARNAEELFADFDKALSLIPGKKKINTHANYAVFEKGAFADRDCLEPKHFKAWVDFAKAHDAGLDFNPTYFSHPKANGLTLGAYDEDIRKFWIDHGKACIRISQYFAEETGEPCVMNIWTGDGMKDVPADRKGPRERFVDAIDQILSEPYDHDKVFPTVESKTFGIGMESYTVGSAETTLLYAATRHVTPLMDNGHYHPTEYVSDKISSLLIYFDRIALHITRPVRWDSDHVVAFDDETREIMKEIVAHDALDRVFMATDYFDASINRVAALALGARNVQKALLQAMLTPHKDLKVLQDKEDFTSLFACHEAMKLMPLGDVWREYCERAGVPDEEHWLQEVKKYEEEVLLKRQ